MTDKRKADKAKAEAKIEQMRTVARVRKRSRVPACGWGRERVFRPYLTAHTFYIRKGFGLTFS